jgi:hypothetical protein
MSNAATDPLSVANDLAPPPRKRKPVAVLIAMCAPYESPETPPLPDVASCAAVAAAP